MISLKATLEAIKSKIANYGTRLDTLEEHEVYSFTEQRIGTWIDGKPLYRKVYDNITMPSVSRTDWYTLLSTSALNIDRMIHIHLYEDTSAIFTSISYSEANTSSAVPYNISYQYRKAENRIAVNGSTNYSNINMLLILEYTKTTD